MATLDFSLLGLNQPGIAERFYAGQQEAQRNALAQQQLMHAQQQNELARQQMAEYERARAAEENVRNYFAQAQAKGTSLTAPEFVQGLYGVSPEKGMAYEKTVAERQKALTEESARRAKLMLDKTQMYRDALQDVKTPQDAARWLQTQVTDPDMAGSPVTKRPLMDAVRSIPTDPAEFDKWKMQSSMGMKDFYDKNKPQYLQQNLGGVAQVLAAPGLGGPATVVPGSTFAKTLTPYEQQKLQIDAQQARIHGFAVDPFNLSGYNFAGGGGGIPNAQPSPVATSSATAAAVVPANSTNMTGSNAQNSMFKALQAGITGNDLLSTMPTPLANQIKAIIEHRAAPPTRGSARADQLMQLVQSVDPTYDAQQYKTKQGIEMAFTQGLPSRTLRSLNVVQDHLNTYAEAAAALTNSNMPLFNSVANKIASITGQPAPTDFNAVKKIVGDELIKSIQGTAGALGDRKAIEEVLSSSNSPAQFASQIDKLQKLIAGQAKGLESQYKSGGGNNAEVLKLFEQAKPKSQRTPPTRDPILDQADAVLRGGK